MTEFWQNGADRVTAEKEEKGLKSAKKQRNFMIVADRRILYAIVGFFGGMYLADQLKITDLQIKILIGFGGALLGYFLATH